MPETRYRASRFCRILGNPTAYQIVRCLVEKSATPTELVEKIGLSLRTISGTLRTLRNIDVVRYETTNRNKLYFLKDDTLRDILNGMERFVQRMRVREW